MQLPEKRVDESGVGISVVQTLENNIVCGYEWGYGRTFK